MIVKLRVGNAVPNSPDVHGDEDAATEHDWRRRRGGCGEQVI